jgi:GT2 family glycosyltransferase
VTKKVGIVVPTLGTRPDYLQQNLKSIRAAGDAHISIVAPQSFDASKLISEGLVDQFVEDPEIGLATAINEGIKQLPAEISFVNWLGDDDILTEGSITKTRKELEKNEKASLVFGACDYIDSTGKRIWKNKSGKWAVPLLRFGPDLVPQPGALFRRDAFNQVGHLSSDFGWAFDYDLFIKLSKAGKAIYLPDTLACFRWHPDSLSVGLRKKSVAEASAVRRSHLPRWIRPISSIWEYPVMKATLIAGNRVSKKGNGKAGQQ